MFLKDYKHVVSTLATIVTIIQFLSGIEICQRVVRQGSVGDISGLPFVTGVFSTSAWLMFSYIVFDYPMMVTNTVGLTLQVVYLIIYLKYCVSVGPWKNLKRQLIFLCSLVGSIAYYTFLSGKDNVTLRNNIGLICCLSSILFCAAPLASLRDVIRMRSTEVLPFPLIIAMFFVGGLWGLYGIIIENSFVTYPNVIVCSIAMVQLFLFLIFPRKSTQNKELLL